VRYLPDFRLPDKAFDLVDQACAAARFRTLTPQAGSAAGRSSHIGKEEIAAVVAARCGIPLGRLTADEGQRLKEMERHLVAEFNRRLTDRKVTVVLDESAIELILREGFSKGYGARNLERAMDRLLGKKLAGLLLAGGAPEGAMLRVEADDGVLRLG